MERLISVERIPPSNSSQSKEILALSSHTNEKGCNGTLRSTDSPITRPWDLMSAALLQM